MVSASTSTSDKIVNLECEDPVSQWLEFVPGSPPCSVALSHIGKEGKHCVFGLAEVHTFGHLWVRLDRWRREVPNDWWGGA